MPLYNPYLLSLSQMHLFRFHSSTTTYLADGDDNTFALNVADYGATYFDSGAHAFVVPEDGIYHLETVAKITNGNTGTGRVQLRADGALLAQSPTVNGTDLYASLSCEVYLAAGAVVTVAVHWNGTAGATSPGDSFLVGNLVSGGNAGAGVIDTTAPTISGYATPVWGDRGDGTFGAQVIWTTSEPATSQVSWTQDGGTTTYETVLDDSLVTSHAINLGPDYPVAGDIVITVKSADASGNLATQTESTTTVA